MYVRKWSKDRFCVGRYRSHPFIYIYISHFIFPSLCLYYHQLTKLLLIIHIQYQYVHYSNVRRVQNAACWETFSPYKALIPCCLPAPQIGEVRDKPIVSYVGDSVVIACKMEETKPKPSTWKWYKANGTDKVGELLRGVFCVALKAQFVR